MALFDPPVKLGTDGGDTSILWSSVTRDQISGKHLIGGRCMVCRGEGRTKKRTAELTKAFRHTMSGGLITRRKRQTHSSSSLIGTRNIILKHSL